jgi:hypothetical protein
MKIHLHFFIVFSVVAACTHKNMVANEAAEAAQQANRTPARAVDAAEVYTVVCQFRPLGVVGRWEINLNRGIGPVYDKFCLIGSEQEYGSHTPAQIVQAITDGIWTPEAGWRYECPN